MCTRAGSDPSSSSFTIDQIGGMMGHATPENHTWGYAVRQRPSPKCRRLMRRANGTGVEAGPQWRFEVSKALLRGRRATLRRSGYRPMSVLDADLDPLERSRTEP